MRLPFVSRERFQEVRADLEAARGRNEQLVDYILAMRREHFEPPTKAGRVIEPPDPELLARRRATEDFVENFVAGAVATGIPEHEARAEARRMREELDQQQAPAL